MPVGAWDVARIGTRALLGMFFSAAVMLAVAWSPASAAASTFNPVADATVDASNPNGTSTTIATLRTDASPTVHAYMRFNVQGVAGPAGARLRVYAETNNSHGFQVRPVTGPDANTWGETTINFNNAPPLGSVIGTSGPVAAGQWITIDLPSLVSGDGLVSLALTSTSSTATKYTSREGANKPELIAPVDPPPAAATAYVVTRSGDTYQSAPSAGGTGFSGLLKPVIDSTVNALRSSGGTITFSSGTFDLGDSWIELKNVSNITFQGQGMDATVFQNNSNQAADTEPFNTSTTHNLVIRDMTVNAGGSPRSTSDAIDMDGGNNALIENVKILQSRARGIVFDGKDISGGQPRTANGNTIRGCVISGVQTLGVQFLAASNNRVEGCTISNVGGHGIQATKSSTSAEQPNKKSNGNVITGNVIDNAGQDGINITSGDSNQILGNTIMNSSSVLSGRDGIRLTANESIGCDDNRVANNRAGDDPSPKTQRYGLHITTSVCHGTIVGPGNDFSGNLTGPFKNSGSGTILL